MIFGVCSMTLKLGQEFGVGVGIGVGRPDARSMEEKELRRIRKKKIGAKGDGTVEDRLLGNKEVVGSNL